MTLEILKKVAITTTCPEAIQTVVNVLYFVLKAIQYVAPVLLILWGTIDLVKSVVAGKEEDIKKNQKTLVKRLISGIIIFLIPIGVSMILSLIGSEDWRKCWDNKKAEIDINVDKN